MVNIAGDEVNISVIKFIIFYVVMVGLFAVYTSLNDFSPFNENLKNPSDIDLTPSLNPISMLQKMYFMIAIAVDPTFILLGIIIAGYTFALLYIFIKALPFT